MDLSTKISLFIVLGSIIFNTQAGTLDDGKALKAAKEKWQAYLPSWIGDDPCLDWEGVICNEDLRVFSLNLSNQGLAGPLPDELQHLDSLVSLDLSNSKHSSGPWNNISGDLLVIENLKQLLFLNMSFNYLSTRFPESVLKLTNLLVLRLDNAGLIGPFPRKLSSLTKLQHVYLGNNSLEGPLLPDIGNLVDLIELSLWGNELNCSIPRELSKLTNLTYLNMHGCDLWGGLPRELGDLINMQTLYLYDNRLSGSIPEEWNNFKKLRNLRLEYNYFTKYLPSWVRHLQSLELLDLEHNMLYGKLENILPEHSQRIDIKCNYFSGARPTLVGTLLEDKGNCFTYTNQEDKKRCSQEFYTCADFSKKVSYGSCAICPPNQYLQNAKTCVCQLGLQGTKHTTAMSKVVFSVVILCVALTFIYFLVHEWKRRAKFLSNVHSNQEFEMFLYHKHIPEEDAF